MYKEKYPLQETFSGGSGGSGLAMDVWEKEIKELSRLRNNIVKKDLEILELNKRITELLTENVELKWKVNIGRKVYI